MKSFRFRIAMLTLFLCGLVLLVFGAGLWKLTQRAAEQRFYSDMRDFGSRLLAAPQQSSEFWRRIEEFSFMRRPPREMGMANDPQPLPALIFSIWDGSENLVHQSSQWPESLSMNRLRPFPEPTLRPKERDSENDSIDPRPFWDPETGPNDSRRPQGRPNWDRRGDPGRPPGNPRNDEDFSEMFQPGRGPFPPGGGRRRARGPLSEMRFIELDVMGEKWKIGLVSSPEYSLAIGVQWSLYRSPFNELRIGFLSLGLTVISLAAAGGWWISHRAIRPVEQLTQTMESITAQGLSSRLTSKAHDTEMSRLVNVFNQMLDRLEKSFTQASRFSADASHELKTPLAILQGQIERAVQKAPESSDEQGFYLQLLEETAGLKSLVEKLLLLAQADSGQLRLAIAEVDLKDLLAVLVEDTEAMSESIEIQYQAPTENCLAHGDEILLQRALSNLLNNAVKYNQENGAIRIELKSMPEENLTQITIDNTGPGISPGARALVFDRFYRGDASRNRKVGGVGLGLSLALEIIQNHNGTLKLFSFKDPSGVDWTRFVVSLPISMREIETSAC